MAIDAGQTWCVCVNGRGECLGAIEKAEWRGGKFKKRGECRSGMVFPRRIFTVRLVTWEGWEAETIELERVKFIREEPDPIGVLLDQEHEHARLAQLREG